AIQNEVVKLAAAAVVEREDPIAGVLEVVAANAVARSTLLVDRCEYSIFVLQDPDRARARAIQDEVVKLAAAVVVEREDSITGVLEVIAANAVARGALRVKRYKVGPIRRRCLAGK